MTWKANYSDGTSLMQFEEEKENSYFAIERDKLNSFDIIKDSGELVLRVSLERPTQKLIYRKRVFTDLYGTQKDLVILAGWHENIEGKSIKSICYIHSDGHIEMAGAKDDCQLFSQETD
jgi:hypothetical protein